MTGVLLAFVSKMEGTTGIAERLAETLYQRGLSMEPRHIDVGLKISDESARAMRSAIYNGVRRGSYDLLLVARDREDGGKSHQHHGG